MIDMMGTGLKVGGILILLVVLSLLTVGIVWQVSIRRSPLQKIFESGHIPNPSPDGFYKGTISLWTSWRGKTFDAVTHTGRNAFLLNDKLEYKYHFTTSVEKGIKDKKLDVLRLDYNVRGNHPLLRLVTDEIVEDAPGHYVGKTHVFIPPGIPFTVAFFELEKE